MSRSMRNRSFSHCRRAISAAWSPTAVLPALWAAATLPAPRLPLVVLVNDVAEVFHSTYYRCPRIRRRLTSYLQQGIPHGRGEPGHLYQIKSELTQLMVSVLNRRRSFSNSAP